MRKALLPLLICLLAPLGRAAEEAHPPAIEFRLVVTNMTADPVEVVVLSHKSSDGQQKDEGVMVLKKPSLDASGVKSAKVKKDELDRARIYITFTDSGREQFAKVTREHVGRRLAVFVGGKILNAPTIDEEISSGTCVIMGNFSVAEAEGFASQINTAAKK